MRTRTIGSAAVAAIAVAGVSAATLGAAPGPPWTPPLQLSNPAKPPAGAAAAALNGAGDGTVVWVECQVATPGPCPGLVDIASVTLRGGAFLAQRTVATNQPPIVRGNLTREGASFVFSWMTLPNRWRQSRARLGGLWQRPPRASRPPRGMGASVTENINGVAVSAYFRGNRLIVEYKRGLARFQQILARTDAVSSVIPQVAVGRDGRATVLWAGRLPGVSPTNAVKVFVTDLRPLVGGPLGLVGGGVSRPISGNVAASNPGLGANLQGDLVAVWNTCSSRSFTGAPGVCTGQVGVQARIRREGRAGFGPTRALTIGAGGNATAPGAAFGRARRAIVTYADNTGVKAASSARASGNWITSAVSTNPAGPIGALLAHNRRAQAAAVTWLERDPDGIRQVPMAAVLQRSGQFSDPAPLDAPGIMLAPPTTSIGPRGHALALWSTLPGGVLALNAARTRIR